MGILLFVYMSLPFRFGTCGEDSQQNKKLVIPNNLANLSEVHRFVSGALIALCESGHPFAHSPNAHDLLGITVFHAGKAS